MKKIVFALALAGFLGQTTMAQEMESAGADETAAVETTEAMEATQAADDMASMQDAEEPQEAASFTKKKKKRFICLILGLAIAIERIIFLNLASTNSQKLTAGVEEALASGGVDAAKELCRNTKGPVASIFYQGLDRVDEGIENAEKAVVAYGGVQMGQLEKNVSWISLFIALAPMLGFMGTVIGMIQAFDKIEAAGDMQPSLVAGGIKVALLTTVFGLIVAIILQIFYNYIVAKIDSIVNDMEDASINLIDILVAYKK